MLLEVYQRTESRLGMGEGMAFLGGSGGDGGRVYMCAWGLFVLVGWGHGLELGLVGCNV